MARFDLLEAIQGDPPAIAAATSARTRSSDGAVERRRPSGGHGAVDRALSSLAVERDPRAGPSSWTPPATPASARSSTSARSSSSRCGRRRSGRGHVRSTGAGQPRSGAYAATSAARSRPESSVVDGRRPAARQRGSTLDPTSVLAARGIVRADSRSGRSMAIVRPTVPRVGRSDGRRRDRSTPHRAVTVPVAVERRPSATSRGASSCHELHASALRSPSSVGLSAVRITADRGAPRRADRSPPAARSSCPRRDPRLARLNDLVGGHLGPLPESRTAGFPASTDAPDRRHDAIQRPSCGLVVPAAPRDPRRHDPLVGRATGHRCRTRRPSRELRRARRRTVPREAPGAVP